MSGFLDLLLRVNLVGGAAILIVLALRPVVGRLFGARVRYALWLAPLLTAAASLIPARVLTVTAPAVQSLSGVMAEAAPAAAATIARPFDASPWLTAAWILGATLAFGLMLRRQAAFVRRSGEGASGPAVVGFLKPRIQLPHDFEERFDEEERTLILAHERTHLHRQDARINGLTGVLCSLNWFNPLVHLAAHLARLDQELSCDEYVVAVFPFARPAYARAMLKTQLAAQPLPLGCYWPARGRHPLEQRIAMLKRTSPRRARRQAGVAAVTLAMLGAGAAAWAVQPPRIKTRPAAHVLEQPPAPPAQTQSRQAPAKPRGDICLSNSCTSTAMLRDRAAIDAAIELGDPVAAMAAGGDADQVLAAIFTAIPSIEQGRGVLNYLGDRSDGSTLGLEDINGTPRLTRYGADSQPQMSAFGSSSGIKEFTAPPGRAISFNRVTGEFTTLPAPESEPAKPLGRAEPQAVLVPAANHEPAPESYVVQEADWIHKPTFDQMLRYARFSDTRRKAQGEVMLRCRVEATGSVSGCAVVSESNPPAELGKSVLRTTKWIRIKPPRVNGVPVENATVLIPFRFNLRQV